MEETYCKRRWEKKKKRKKEKKSSDWTNGSEMILIIVKRKWRRGYHLSIGKQPFGGDMTLISGSDWESDIIKVIYILQISSSPWCILPLVAWWFPPPIYVSSSLPHYFAFEFQYNPSIYPSFFYATI